jgi:hypothetical protein
MISNLEAELKEIRENAKFIDHMTLLKGKILDLVLYGAMKPPYLQNFHLTMRKMSLDELKTLFPKIWERHEAMKRQTPHEEQYGEILPQSFALVLIEDVDVLFDVLSARVEEKQKKQRLVDSACIEDMKLSPKMLNLIPTDPDMREYAFELFVKWIMKIEKNVDLMQRAYSYGYIRDEVDGEFLQRLHEGNMPQTIIFKTSLNAFMSGLLDSVIEKTFVRNMDRLTSKISTALLSSLLVSLFGGPVVGLGGFVVSLVDLPFEVDLNIAKPLLAPLIEQLKKALNIGNRDVFRVLLLEVISDTEASNVELEQLIHAVAKRPFMDTAQQHLLVSLRLHVRDIVAGKRKKSNWRSKPDDSQLMVVKQSLIDGESFESLQEFKDAVMIKPLEDDDDDFQVVGLKDGYNLVEEEDSILYIKEIEDKVEEFETVQQPPETSDPPKTESAEQTSLPKSNSESTKNNSEISTSNKEGQISELTNSNIHPKELATKLSSENPYMTSDHQPREQIPKSNLVKSEYRSNPYVEQWFNDHPKDSITKSKANLIDSKISQQATKTEKKPLQSSSSKLDSEEDIEKSKLKPTNPS